MADSDAGDSATRPPAKSEANEASESARATTPSVRGGDVGAVAAGHAVVIAHPAAAGPGLPPISRRGVLKVGFWCGLGVMLATIGTTIVYGLYPRRAPANGGQQLIGTSEVSPFGGIISVGTVDQLAVGQKLH